VQPSVDEPHEQILLLVREHGSLRVTDPAEALGVSAVTARRDVETLAEAGRLQRAHGFVAWPDPAAELRPGQLLGAGAQARRALPPDTVLGLLVPAVSQFTTLQPSTSHSARPVRGGPLRLLTTPNELLTYRQNLRRGVGISQRPGIPSNGRTSGESVPARAVAAVIRLRWWRRQRTS
jgi:DNA-binding Lrp family transcriptional regulator